MVMSQIVVSVLLALLTGLVFNQIKPTVEAGVQNRFGVIFFIVVNQIYSTTTALEPLVQERALFIHVDPLRHRIQSIQLKTVDLRSRRILVVITVCRRISSPS